MKNIKLFDYQEDIVSRIEEALRRHDSVMVQMPTGTGKTMVLANIVFSFLEKEQKTVWIVAHRRELVSQIEETIQRVFSVNTDNTDSSLIKVTSVQWLAKHYEEIGEVPGMVVIDEAHHALAKTYKEMWERFPGTKFLGLTATPCRLNGKGFTDLFEVLVSSWDIPEFISKGRLATYDFVSIKTDSVTQRLVDSLQKRGADGDYQNKEMDRVLNKRPSIERLFQAFLDFGKYRKGIVYAINIDHAKAIAEFYREHGVVAVAIDSKTPSSLRKELIERFKLSSFSNTENTENTDIFSNTNRTNCTNAIQVLVNVDIFSEGFDCPDVEFVQLARPTLSLAKYLQMVGRGLRVAKGKKNCVIIDNVGLYRVFGLPSQVWDWEAMFEGKLKVGKKKDNAKERNFFLEGVKQENTLTRPDSEMMMVVNHENLLKELTSREFVDSKDDFAIVRLSDGRMTVVNRLGEQVLPSGKYYGMKLLRGNILYYMPRRKTQCYYDLLARAVIDEGVKLKAVPRVVKLQGWEFVEYDSKYYARTHEKFCFSQRPSQYELWDRGHYMTYRYQTATDSGCQVWMYLGNERRMSLYDANSREACFLRGDHSQVYWLCATLYGDNIVIMDSKENYYLVDSSLKKTYIGCNHPKGEKEDLNYVMPRIGRQFYDKKMQDERKQEEKDLQRQHEKSDSGSVEIYQNGRKWGVKMDGKIVVPPIYLQISPPVGAYCAFEQIPRHWGVMTVKGKIVVEPKYEKVEVKDSHTAVVTLITGKTQEIALG